MTKDEAKSKVLTMVNAVSGAALNRFSDAEVFAFETLYVEAKAFVDGDLESDDLEMLTLRAELDGVSVEATSVEYFEAGRVMRRLAAIISHIRRDVGYKIDNAVTEEELPAILAEAKQHFIDHLNEYNFEAFALAVQAGQ